jgi:hypothetical protein
MPALVKRNVSLFLYSKKSGPELLVALCVFTICLAFTFLLLVKDQHSLLYYGDAVSHLVMSRRVFDSIQPGTGLGGVWLPLTHLMLMPFVTSDFLFHTGLAGTIVSTASTSVTAAILFRIAKLQFNLSMMAGLTASSLYIMNPSVIYMGIVPMMEAPFIMFFVLSVYYLQRVCHYYIGMIGNIGNTQPNFSVYTSNQERILLVKCAMAISAATVTRYEGWLLPLGFIFVLIIIALVLSRKKETSRPRIKWIVIFPVLLSFSGILFWLIWDFVYFKDPLYFATGPYSSQVQTKPFSGYLHLNPALVLSILLGVINSMYGIPVLIVAVLGFVFYLRAGKRDHRQLLLFLLTSAILAIPFLLNFLAMVGGSEAIYPTKNGNGWFNGRYLVTLSPLLAFWSISLIMSFKDQMGRKSIPSRIAGGIVIFIVILSYIYTFLSQQVELVKTTVLNDRYALLPFLKYFQFAFDTGETLRKLHSDNKLIVLFTTSQGGQQIMLESGIPLKNFIDVSSGTYWAISKSSPWTYGTYLVIRKPNDTHADPMNNLINYWITNQQILMKHYTLAYENPYYIILKR